MKIIHLLVVFSLVTCASCTISLVRDLLQYNAFGVPVLYKTQEWAFDPDEGPRRSKQYQELNGRCGEKAIERLGLGVDGFDAERRVQQQQRDIQLLGRSY